MVTLHMITVIILFFGTLTSIHAEDFINVQPSAVLRAAPDIKSANVTDINFATKVTIISYGENEVLALGTNGFWHKVRAGTKEGWIFSRLLVSDLSRPTKVMQGQLVPADWKEEPVVNVNGKLPPPPAKCESLQHYLFTRLNPVTEFRMANISDSTSTRWVRERAFELGAKYQYTYGMHWSEEQMEIPGIESPEAFSLALACSRVSKKGPPRKKKSGGLRFCQTEWREDGQEAGFTNVETSIKPSGVVVYLQVSAHEACPVKPLH
jgi:hypothetical protein